MKKLLFIAFILTLTFNVVAEASLKLSDNERRIAKIFLRNFKENSNMRLDFLERTINDPVRNERKWYLHYGFLLDMVNLGDGHKVYNWNQRRLIYNFLYIVFDRLPAGYQKDIRTLLIMQYKSELLLDYQTHSVAAYIKLLGQCGDQSPEDQTITEYLALILDMPKIKQSITTTAAIPDALISAARDVLVEDRAGLYLKSNFFKAFFRVIDVDTDGDKWRRSHREAMNVVMTEYMNRISRNSE